MNNVETRGSSHVEDERWYRLAREHIRSHTLVTMPWITSQQTRSVHVIGIHQNTSSSMKIVLPPKENDAEGITRYVFHHPGRGELSKYRCSWEVNKDANKMDTICISIWFLNVVSGASVHNNGHGRFVVAHWEQETSALREANQYLRATQHMG